MGARSRDSEPSEPHGLGPRLKFVRGLACHGSILSGVGVSGKLGAVHPRGFERVEEGLVTEGRGGIWLMNSGWIWPRLTAGRISDANLAHRCHTLAGDVGRMGVSGPFVFQGESIGPAFK
jgi:hypothetical protein